MTDSFRIAVAQSRIERDIGANGHHIRKLLDQAAAAEARLVLFPEGALSGYAKTQIRDWCGMDWGALEEEVAAISAHAGKLGITAVVGTAHAVDGRPPNNSLAVLPQGPRYDKRMLSHTEVSGWYSPGFEAVTIRQAGFVFGMTICIEMQFPELFAGYEKLGVDCVLHATYGLSPMGDVILRAHAATNCLFLAVATPANADQPPSGIIGPDGEWMVQCAAGPGIAVADMARHDPRFDIPLNKARPWRRLAREGRIYRDVR